MVSAVPPSSCYMEQLALEGFDETSYALVFDRHHLDEDPRRMVIPFYQDAEDELVYLVSIMLPLSR